MPELQKVSQAIEGKIKLLERGRAELQKRSTAKAEAIAEYEKTLAIRMLELKNSDEEIVWEGQTFKQLPITILEKVAKGTIWEKKLKADEAETAYKNAVVGLRVIESELSGYQSIHKWLDEK